MKMFDKLKDILFDEVEEDEKEIKVKKKEEKTVQKQPEVQIAERIEPQKRPERVEDRPPVIDRGKKMEADTISFDDLSERDLYSSAPKKDTNTFSFPDFDEEEFSSNYNPRPQVVEKPRPTTNVLEYERKKKTEKRYDFGKYERVETKEVVEKKKFKPSPIISPVYGILNEDYKIEDIKNKNEVNNDSLDIESVRKKAYPEVESIEEKIDVLPKEEYFEEETVTVNIKENDDKKSEKVRTIDELLEDTADEIISVENSPKKVSDYEDMEKELDAFINEEPVVEEPKEEVDIDEDQTLENDLFDLIDSMYDNREDGDE